MNNYITKGKTIKVEKIKKEIETRLNNEYNKKLLKKIKNNKYTSYETMLDCASKGIFELNEAMLSDRDIFAVCQKQPKGNLDTGRHYYSIHYIKDNKVNKLWLYDIIELFGGTTQDRDRNIDKFIWASGAIGMSRLLATTDGLFSFIKELGGCYAQISCI